MVGMVFYVLLFGGTVFIVLYVVMTLLRLLERAV